VRIYLPNAGLQPQCANRMNSLPFDINVILCFVGMVFLMIVATVGYFT